MRFVRTTAAVLLALLIAAGASAQTKGKLRLTGKVLNETGAPVEGADVRAARKGEMAPQTPIATKTDKNGDWSLKDLAAGDWVIEASKEGVGTVEVTETLTDADKSGKAVTITIKPKVDPNAEIQAGHQQAVQLAQANKPAEARKIWEDLLAKYPQVHQFHGTIGTMYAAENNPAKAIEHLKLALEKDPSNVPWQVLMAELMMETGERDAAEKVLMSLDITKVTDPRAYMNMAINKINAGDKAQAEQAVEVLTKLIAQFPNEHMLLYLRGRAYLVSTKNVEAKADLEKYVAAAPATAPQVADAKKLLEQLTKK